MEAITDERLSSHIGMESGWLAPGEEIFAVSYMELKLEGQGFLSTGPKAPVIGDTVLASNKHAALKPPGDRDSGSDDNSSSSSDSEEEGEDRVEQPMTAVLG